MKRRRRTPEQIIRKLREADRMLAGGADVPEVAKALEISELLTGMRSVDLWPGHF